MHQTFSKAVWLDGPRQSLSGSCMACLSYACKLGRDQHGTEASQLQVSTHSTARWCQEHIKFISTVPSTGQLRHLPFYSIQTGKRIQLASCSSTHPLFSSPINTVPPPWELTTPININSSCVVPEINESLDLCLSSGACIASHIYSV